MKNKKILSLLLAVTMLVALVIPVQAADENKILKVVSGNDITKANMVSVYDAQGYDLEGDGVSSTIALTATDACPHADQAQYSSLTVAKALAGAMSPDTDVCSGSACFQSCYYGGKPTITIDLGTNKDFDRIDIWSSKSRWAGYNETNNDSTITADSITVKVSDDNRAWTDVTLTKNRWKGEYHSTGTRTLDKLTFNSVNGRYIQIAWSETSQTFLDEIVVFDGEREPAEAATEFYSLTGYAVPDLVSGLYAAQGITILEDTTATVNHAIIATATTTDDNGNTENLGDNNSTENVLSGNTKNNKGIQYKWAGGTRCTVIDLKGVQNVSRVDLVTLGQGKYTSGKASAISLESSSSAEGPWTAVKSITPKTDSDYFKTENTEGSLNDKGDNWYFQEIVLESPISTRYLRVKISYDKNYNLCYVGVFGTSAPIYTPSYGNDLTLLSNNIYGDSGYNNPFAVTQGYNVTKAETPARYKYVDTTYTSNPTDNTDEATRDADGYVITDSSKTAYPQPDLIDGAWGNGEGLTQTDYWGNTQMNVLWDMGASTKIDRIDIASVDGAYGVGRLVKGAKISVGDDPDNLTTIIDAYSSAVIAQDLTEAEKEASSGSRSARWHVFDLGGVQGRYIKVEMISTQNQIQLGEMYIYGEAPEIPVTATAPKFYDAGGNDWDGDNSFQDVLGSVKTTVSDGTGTLVVAWYNDAEGVKEALLKKVWVATGSGEVSVNISESESEEIISSIDANTGALKAFVFKNVQDASLIAGAVSLTLGE